MTYTSTTILLRLWDFKQTDLNASIAKWWVVGTQMAKDNLIKEYMSQSLKDWWTVLFSSQPHSALLVQLMKEGGQVEQIPWPQLQTSYILSLDYSETVMACQVWQRYIWRVTCGSGYLVCTTNRCYLSVDLSLQSMRNHSWLSLENYDIFCKKTILKCVSEDFLKMIYDVINQITNAIPT